MIFVVGVSCAGKTHSVARLLELEPSFSRLSASGILHELGRPLRPLTPTEALENQSALADVLLARGLDGGDLVLLDGHATVETTDGPMPVPDGWYDALPFCAIVVIEADPVDIADRRARRGLPWSEADAMAYQEFERLHASAQARRLSIPFLATEPAGVDALPTRILDAVSRRRGGSDAR